MSDVEDNEPVVNGVEKNEEDQHYEEQAQDGATAKRKRDEDAAADQSEEQDYENADNDQSKKIKVVEGGDVSSAPQATTPAPVSSGPAAIPGQELLVLEITPDKVGQIIGSKGMIIQEIQTRSGAKAYVNQDFPDGVNRQVNITGSSEQVRAAADLINLIITQGPTAIHVNSMAGGPTVTQIIECTQPQVGKIIGTGGAVIKELQSKSGARIQIDQDFPPEVPRKINVTGTAAAVTLGIQLIQNVMAGGSMLGGMPGGMGMSPYGAPGGFGGAPAGGMGAMQTYGNEAKQTIEVPKMIVGKIIGRGGEVITMIQRKSGARAMVDQQVPDGMPCKVNITGSPQTVAACAQIIQEIMMGVPVQQAGANLPPPQQASPYGAAAASPYGANPYGMAQGGYPNMAMGGMGMPQMMPQYGAYGANPYANPQMAQMQQQYAMGAGGYQAYGQPGMYGANGAVAGAYGAQPGMAAMPGAAVAGAGAVGAKPAAASPWTEHKTDEGVTYWYNSTTGVSQVQ